MYTITAQDHDQGRDPVTIFRSNAKYVAKYVRLLREEGYRTVATLDVCAMTTVEDVRAVLADIHSHEPVDHRVLEHAFEVVHGRRPERLETHPYLCLERVRQAVMSAAAGGA